MDRSIGTLAFLERFPIHTDPTPSPHPTNKVGSVYPEFFPSFNFVWKGGGARELRDNFQKDVLFYEVTQKYDFCPWLQTWTEVLEPLCIFGVFSNTHRPTPPLTPQTTLELCVQNFFLSFNFL